MLPVKLVRSLVLGEPMTTPFPHHHPHHEHEHEHDHHDHDNNKKRIPLLLFTPTKELISDTFRLASIARDIGMDFHPTPSLSHLIFSWPPSYPSSSSSSPFTPSSSSSSTSSSSTIPNNPSPLPFPSLSTPSTSLSLLRHFVSLSNGLFKLAFFTPGPGPWAGFRPNWGPQEGPSRVFLCSRISGRRVGSMDELSREMAGQGWALFRTRKAVPEAGSVYLFRREESSRVRVRDKEGFGRSRMRELRLGELDFRDGGVPLRVLLYILLMTDDIFYLAE